ncbi:MAG: Mur ligase family protein [Patescibacteria group bacterium]|nr:Mur ligase family protein [Patescibacteria group bacterium]
MKHIHFIGICGVGMSALAILWQKKGWKVTGSDAGFFPPISTHLKKHGIEFYPGWHPEKMTGQEGSLPDLVVVGNVAASENPEWKFTLENKIPYVSYPELIAKNLVKKNSIICAGTYGKTSTTAILAWILKNANYKPSYMFGGLSLDMEESADDLGGDWSILEGDEYKASRWDNRAKFFSYQPTHLLLTATEWDHADIYPTEKDYFNAFRELIKIIPENGLIVISENVPESIISLSRAKILKYGKKENCDYGYSDVKIDKNGIALKITFGNSHFFVSSNVIGEYMAENICGAFALAREIGIAPETIIKSLADFNGLKRRMEKRGKTQSGADVFDDIAHSPAKAKSVLETLKKIYNGKIYAIFEPNTGNRQPQSAPQYDYAFAAADEVIIPRLTKIKSSEEQKHLNGGELANIIFRSHSAVKHIEDDDYLINYIKQKTQPRDAVVFLGSHGFRGMIEKILD